MVPKSNLSILIRIFSYSILAITFVFLLNNVLTVWFDWPGVKKLFSPMTTSKISKQTIKGIDTIILDILKKFAKLYMFFFAFKVLFNKLY